MADTQWDYRMPRVRGEDSTLWQKCIARVLIRNANQKWANYPESPSTIVPVVGLVNSERFPYQVIVETPGVVGIVPGGTHLWMSAVPMTVSLDSNQKYRVSHVTYQAFRLVDGAWEYVSAVSGFIISSMYEASHDIYKHDTSELYFAKTTTPEMDYSGTHWVRRLVRVRA